MEFDECRFGFNREDAERMDYKNMRSTAGTITRVSSNSVVYVSVDDDQSRSVSFTPSKVQGYRGQDFHSFGLTPGTRVQFSWNPDSGRVVGEVKLAKTG